mgnify:CR=1 FL=1|tara:strand:- start:18 stop:1205 length:1188 start_codon:yes stop_codon:yes gene_type:complete
MTKNKVIHQSYIQKGLYLYKTGRSPFYFARIWNPKNKKYVVKSTKEKSKIDARNVAEELLEKYKSSPNFDKTPKDFLFNSYIDLLLTQNNKLSGKSRSKFFGRDDEVKIERKDDGIRQYFGAKDITSITTFDIRTYLDFLDSNREKPLANSTRTKHIVLIRKIMKIAYEKGILQQIPLMPPTSRKDNPRPSFTEKEYKKVLETTRKCIEDEEIVRGIQLTWEVYYFIVFLVHSFMRPIETEIFAIKYKDITVRKNPDRLEIRIKGKTGFRTVSTLQGAVDFLEKLKKINPNYKENDYLFFNEYPNRTTASRNFQRQFAFILDKGNLRETEDGVLRTPYVLRHYALQTRLRKSKGKVNIFNLAKNAGTSVEQLERFYLKNMEFSDDLVENLQTFGD